MPVTLPFLLLTISLPKPSIIWHQARDAEGKHHLRCIAQEEYAGSWFYLYQGGSKEPMMEKKALPAQSKVTFAVHVFGPNEQFYCSYKIWKGGEAVYSPLSNPENITEDHYPKPSIAVNPGTQVLAGQDWTICCWASFPGVAFVLYQDREFKMEVTPRGDSSVAEFSFKNASASDAGKYTCYYHSITDPVIWSNASDPVQLGVIDVAVSSYQEVLVDAAGRYRVNCSGPSTSEGWFYLYCDGKLFAETRAWQDGSTINFNLTEEALSAIKGELSCQYGDNWLNDTEVWTQDLHSQSTDFSTANLLRLLLGGSIFSLGLLFVADACWKRRHQED